MMTPRWPTLRGWDDPAGNDNLAIAETTGYTFEKRSNTASGESDINQPASDNPYIRGRLAPWPMEGEIHDVAVEGEIPEQLRGSYYRNGANPQFPQLESYHIFDGDGMIHAFEIEAGRCRYLNRWVRTERFQLERNEGERVFNGLLSGLPPDPRSTGVSGNAANTNVVWHGGRLLALWEAGPPYELDPNGLATLGVCDFDGKLRREAGPGSFTAHPKIDPKTGEMIFFGYNLAPPYLNYGVIDPTGRLVRWIEIESPHPSMLHDFVVTDRHVVFPVFPNTFSPENFSKTGMPFAWEPERGTHLGVMPRDGGADDVVWLTADPCNVFHFLNAHSEGDRVTIDFCRFDALPLFGLESGLPRLCRWTLDVAAGTVHEERLDDVVVEFPRVDDRIAGLRHRHGWFSSSMETGEKLGGVGVFNAVVHHDFERGTRRHHQLADEDFAGEPVFVPRSADADEGDGFLLFLAYRGEERRSQLMVFDAQNIDREPLAKVLLPHPVPLGFHGNWRQAE
jgi:carotenoid cleavage dioxygenase-like enzyme